MIWTVAFIAVSYTLTIRFAFNFLILVSEGTRK